MNFLAAAQYLAAVSTPCQTPGSQFHTHIADQQVGVTVDLPHSLGLTAKQADVLDSNLHNAMELVLAPYFVGVPHEGSRHLADMTSDSLDPTMQDAALPTSRTWGQPTPQTDELDPAAPGGPSPYNGVEPFGEPVTSDQMWLDPKGPKPPTHTPLPHIKGPDEDVTTLHSARLLSYEAKAARYGRG